MSLIVTPRSAVIWLAAMSMMGLIQAQTAVTLAPAALPAAGKAGVTNVTLTGSGFPTGSILPADTDIRLEPSAGGTSVTTKARTVVLAVGTTRRVAFVIPASISVSAPTGYTISISGQTTQGAAFASTNKVPITIVPSN